MVLLKRLLRLSVALCLILTIVLGLSPFASAATVVGAVSPSGVLDLTDVGYTVVDAGLPDRMRLRYYYELDKSPCYWITQYSDDVGVSYTDGSTAFTLTDVNHYVFPSGNTYVKLPFDPGIMSNISMNLCTGLKMNVKATGQQYRWAEIDFFDSGFNLISTYKSAETSYSLSYDASVSSTGVSVSGLSIPEGTVYIFPRLGIRRALSYKTSVYLSGVSFNFQCDVANEFAPVATTPVVESSFAGQTIYLDVGQTAKLSLFAGSINGIGGVVWQYKLPDEVVWNTVKTDTLYHDSVNNLHYGAWEYSDSDGDGPYNFQIRATVTNTVGDNVVSVTTEPATLIFGDVDTGGSGDGSFDSDSLVQVQEDVQAVMDAVGKTNEKLDGLGDSFDLIISGDSGVDSSVTDFNDVSVSFSGTLSDANAVIDSGVASLNGFVSSQQMFGTAAAVGSILTAAFVGNEISLCGISGNPFELAVIFFGSMGVIVLVITYVFRKRGGG